MSPLRSCSSSSAPRACPFEGGAGIFEYDDEDNGQKITVHGVWDLITPRSCCQQGSSRDGGASWALNWSMNWVRVG